MVYCAYCGFHFTRKEHLERHLHKHTNVRPFKCSFCQLDFSRRDLLQRHHSTYHEARDPMEPLPGSTPTIGGKTPIACLHCSQAKTACDKRVPCARCQDKGLHCEPRFARRVSKNVHRSTPQPAAMNNQVAATAQIPLPTINPTFMAMDQVTVKPDPNTNVPSPSPNYFMTIDPRIQNENVAFKLPPVTSQNVLDEGPSPHTNMDFDNFFQMGTDIFGTDNEAFSWADYQYQPQTQGPAPMFGMPAFGRANDASSSPETFSSPRGSIHTRNTSLVSAGDFDSLIQQQARVKMIPSVGIDATSPGYDADIIASVKAWPLARCNTPVFSGTCPRTAIFHLECLEQKSRNDGTWSDLEQHMVGLDWDATDLASVVAIKPRTRDTMLAITQRFLHKALEIHRGGVHSDKKMYARPNLLTFLVLPPSSILEYFLKSYARNLSFFYSLASTGLVDPNEIMENNQAATILVLLMVAQGASAVQRPEARALSAGLVELCRISLFDIIEKDVEMSADPIVLRCALLFILLAAWSGDKWLMDKAMAQRGMYIAMMKYSGMLELQPFVSSYFKGPSFDKHEQWLSWLRAETQSRLVHNWVMLDQELSLFHDAAPVLQITELRAPLPGPEVLWMSRTPEQWGSSIQDFPNSTLPLSSSLYELFQEFIHGNLPREDVHLTPHKLRLLLHPLQALLFHLQQLLSCTSVSLDMPRSGPKLVTEESTISRIEEVQGLLHQWYELNNACVEAHTECPVSRLNLVLYHLVSLNAVTNFPEMERLARQGGLHGSQWEPSILHKQCVYQRRAAILHCGQVFRLLNVMPIDQRPSWWSVALYRTTLILWTDSICLLDPNLPERDLTGNLIAIDQVILQHPITIHPYENFTEVPVLAQDADSVVSLESPAGILTYAIKKLQVETSSRLNDGIKRKLMSLRDRWGTYCGNLHRHS